MSMGYSANYADVIKNKTLGKIIGDNDLVEDFVKKYDAFDRDEDELSYDDLNDDLNCGEDSDCDSEGLKELRKVWDNIRMAFNKETGLTLELDYHSKKEGDAHYDEVDGMVFCVRGLYQPTENYKTMMKKFGKKVVERKFYVSFG